MRIVVIKPVAFILALALILGATVVPSFAGSSIYNEVSVVNGVDTSFEKQSEISKVRAQSYDGARTLNSDSHKARFSLKIGNTGLTESALCCIIDSSIDLSKYNQVTMWVKPKGYNLPFTLYTVIAGEQTTIGAIQISNLKADVWQQVSFDLLSVSATTMSGLYTYAYNNKSLLIDDICFTKSYVNTETWDLNAGGTNTLPTEMAYQENIGVTLQKDVTNSAIYKSGAKVASIENQIMGQVSKVNINSSSLGSQTSLISTSSATYLNGIAATNSALYSFDKNGRYLYYYDSNENGLIINDRLNNTRTKIFNGEVKLVRTNDAGNKIAFIDGASNLYLVPSPTTANPENISAQAIKIANGIITNVFFSKENLYYVCNNILYTVDKNNLSKKISDYYSSLVNIIDEPNASLINNSTVYRYYYYSSYLNNGSFSYQIKRHDNFKVCDDVILYTKGINSSTYWGGYLNIVKANSTGSMVLVRNSYTTDYYLLDNMNTNQAKETSLGRIGDTSYAPYFIGDRYYYKTDDFRYYSENYKFDSSLDINNSEDSFVLIENYSSIYLINKSYASDKELLAQFSTQANINSKPESKAVVVNVKFSNLPNQVFAQMENGDIYSFDTRTKTSRLIINQMVMYDVLSDGRLLLSDMNNPKRFLLFDPSKDNKEVFTLDNRNTGAYFTIQFNEASKTVCYLNNENKMQVLPLTGAETEDKYALMLNNDNKWWVYKNNAWKTIYTGSDCPSTGLMESVGMTAAEVNAITEKELLKLPENAKPDTLRIAVYFNSNSPYATPVLKSISVSTKDAEANLDSNIAYGTRIKEYNKTNFRDISAIHVTENKDSTDEIFYFLVVNDTPYSIRNGEACDIDMTATQLFGNAKDNYMNIMTYGMSAKELANLPADSLKEILITKNTTDTFGIVAVIKTLNKNTKDVKLDYILESLQKRFDDAVTTIKITLTDDTLLQYTSGEVSKEEMEKFADWVMDRKYNRGPVFFTFHVNGKYKVINYYMIKMFSVE